MRYFPIFLDLKDRHAIVVGGGEEALRKVRLLLKTEAKISVIASGLHRELASEPRVKWLAQEFSEHLLDDAAIVFSADPALNAAVSRAAQERNIPVNTVDDAPLCTFIVPSIVDRDPVVVAIGTEGTAPVLGRGIRATIDALLPQALGTLAKAAAGLRPRVARAIPPGNRRRSFWQRYFFGDIRDYFLAGDLRRYSSGVENLLRDAATAQMGSVSLVSIGAGDPELLTLRAQRKLQEADVIVHDRRASPTLLEMARRDARRIEVPAGQYGDCALLIREARAGNIVVRLLSSIDRRYEEWLSRDAQDIPVEAVPGITGTRDADADGFVFPVRKDITDAVLRFAS
jgi:uroporphyrin-III C-methyltransferase/precorrin-2 dehydrogenase/sirohydrochlorin ferrochelatase